MKPFLGLCEVSLANTFSYPLRLNIFHEMNTRWCVFVTFCWIAMIMQLSCSEFGSDERFLPKYTKWQASKTVSRCKKNTDTRRAIARCGFIFLTKPEEFFLESVLLEVWKISRLNSASEMFRRGLCKGVCFISEVCYRRVGILLDRFKGSRIFLWCICFLTKIDECINLIVNEV